MSTSLEDYPTFGWKPHPELSDDENFIDLALILCRSSILKQGSMACILVRTNNNNKDKSDLISQIVSVSTNQSLYKRSHSDVHAEIVALGAAAKEGLSTKGLTAYVTMDPCKNCFAALTVFGVQRIVTRKPYSELIHRVANERGIELVTVESTEEQKQRIVELVRSFKEPDDG
jgi:dCMP deaminase